MKELIKKLHAIGAVKFGTFTLKSGIESPIYLDLRLIVSYPELLEKVADLIWSKAKEAPCDLICGVPYTALPIATAISLKHSVPMVMRRKEIKEYGTKKAIEGAFEKGQNCLVIEDLVTSGGSVLETVAPLKHEGLQVTDIAVLIDREQGARDRLEKEGLRLHSALTITEILETLTAEACITEETKTKVLDFIFQTQV